MAVDFARLAKAKRIPGLESCYLQRTGPGVGVRETRRIVGEFVLTKEDACSGTEFPDVVARRYGSPAWSKLLCSVRHRSATPG